SASPRDELERDDQGQVVREGIAVECVNPAEFEVVTEEQMVEGLGWLPGRKGGGRGGLGEDGFLKQRQFRVFLDVEVAGQDGGHILAADVFGDVVNLGGPDWRVQAQMGDEQAAVPVV